MGTSSKTNTKLSALQSRRALALTAYCANPSESAHEAAWRAYQPLVEFAARSFVKNDDALALMAEIIDAGNVGLLDALAAYTPSGSKGGAENELARFNALAMPLIRAAISRSLVVQRIHAFKHTQRLELAEKLNLKQVQKSIEQTLPELEFLNAVLAYVEKPRKAR